MKKRKIITNIMLFAGLIASILLLTMSCFYRRGPYPAPIHQPIENVVKVDVVSGLKEKALYSSETYQDCVIYTLEPEEFAPFIEGLQSISFYTPGYEPARDLGYFAVWIYYKDGNSDLIGTICNKYYDPNLNHLDYGIDRPDREPFYALAEQYVDPALLPRSWD